MRCALSSFVVDSNFDPFTRSIHFSMVRVRSRFNTTATVSTVEAFVIASSLFISHDIIARKDSASCSKGDILEDEFEAAAAHFSIQKGTASRPIGAILSKVTEMCAR